PVQADDGGKVVIIPLVPRTARATTIAAALRCPPGGRAGHHGGRNLPNGFSPAPVPGPPVATCAALDDCRSTPGQTVRGGRGAEPDQACCCYRDSRRPS